MARTVDTFGTTDVGRWRERNEDHYYLDDEEGLYLVADGMGGHAAGEVASHAAVNAICDFISRARKDRDFTWPFGIDSNLSKEENLILSGIKLANREIYALSEGESHLDGMGTTVVGLKTDGDDFIVAHVGDSRAYRLRNDVLEQLTSDHSWVTEQLARSIISEEEARRHRWRNVITRALGGKHSIDVDMSRATVAAGDVFLMCTDGLNGMISDEEIHRVLRASAESAELAARRLVQRANEAGGNDNITVIVVRVVETDPRSDLSDRDTKVIHSATESGMPTEM